MSDPVETNQPTNVAVVGRIPFDDEDSVYCYEGVTIKQAIAMFNADIYADDGREDAAEVIQKEGRSTFITRVLVSETPIRMAEIPA